MLRLLLNFVLLSSIGMGCPMYSFGPELVTNGEFDGNADGWTGIGTGEQFGIQYNSNRVEVVPLYDADPDLLYLTGSLQQNGLSITAGKKYRVEIDYTIINDVADVSFGFFHSVTDDFEILEITSGSNVVDFVAQNNYDGIQWYYENPAGMSANEVCYTIDNVSIKEILGEDPMAHFYYYKTGSGADRCYKLVNPKNGYVWDAAASAMITLAALAAKSDDSDGFTDITRDEQAHGYPITLPATLPVGQYDILFFNSTAAAMEADMTQAVEQGYGIKWNPNAGLLNPPRQILTDLVK